MKKVKREKSKKGQLKADLFFSPTIFSAYSSKWFGCFLYPINSKNAVNNTTFFYTKVNCNYSQFPHKFNLCRIFLISGLKQCTTIVLCEPLQRKCKIEQLKFLVNGPLSRLYCTTKKRYWNMSWYHSINNLTESTLFHFVVRNTGVPYNNNFPSMIKSCCGMLLLFYCQSKLTLTLQGQALFLSDFLQWLGRKGV